MPYLLKKSQKETLEVFEIERFIKRSKLKREGASEGFP
jgi:hypothetical protein